MRGRSSQASWAGRDVVAQCRAWQILLGTRNGLHGHDLDRIARKYRKMRMTFEEPGSRLMRFSLHDDESSHRIGGVFDPARRGLLGLAQGSADGTDDRLMFLHPCPPCGSSLLFLRTALRLRQSVPGRALRTVFSAQEYRKIGIVCAHVSSLL